MAMTARGTFEVTMRQAPPELDGAVSRFALTKAFRGELTGSGAGLMLSAGDPATGAAGYVAIEVVEGVLHGRSGGFALQQFGTASAGEQTLHYEVVPGSGSNDLAGLTGTVRLTVDEDGCHRYELHYEI